MIWRAAAVLAEATTDPVEATGLRRRASDIVSAMGDSLDDVELKERFLAHPGVAAMLDSV